MQSLRVVHVVPFLQEVDLRTLLLRASARHAAGVRRSPGDVSEKGREEAGVAPDSLIIEVTGDEDKIDSLHSLLNAFGVLEVMRTGTIALNRGMNGRGDNENSNGSRPRRATVNETGSV